MSDSVTLWTVAYLAPLSMECSWLEYWSGMPFLTPGHLPDPGIDPVSSALAGGIFTIEPVVNGAGTAKQTHAKYNTQSTNNQRKKQKKNFCASKDSQGTSLAATKWIGNQIFSTPFLDHVDFRNHQHNKSKIRGSAGLQLLI
ncbi:unnamed protein product [Rangifer tarandus platyrhynchus]|uniref:Uncharacterized protein n=1 Tax=Rangifer tarandus platyrhynchus TaxID=3082113 RepID=A0AC59YHL9_RANTA